MSNLTRRSWLAGTFGTLAVLAAGSSVQAQQSSTSFERWVAAFRPRALARGVSEKTYDRVMDGVKPDTSVYALDRAQPEFTEELWQYVNRRCSDHRVITGKTRAKEYDALLAKIEQDYGVDRYLMLGLWGMESSFGDVVANPRYMKPVIPALAALAWGEPRRRKYWEQELLNALVIIQRGWAEPSEMVGSWAGAMGHTQWMPEVWLNMGIDYNKDGKISPFQPDDALAGTAAYIAKRGRYRRGEI
jgi:lytic murein transglycosylase